MYCDNKGLFYCIETHKDKQKPSPRQFLYSGIDVEMQIIDTLKTLVIQTIEFIHVKGHQDNTENIEELEWPVTMNIYCDQLATKALEKHKNTKTH